MNFTNEQIKAYFQLIAFLAHGQCSTNPMTILFTFVQRSPEKKISDDFASPEIIEIKVCHRQTDKSYTQCAVGWFFDEICTSLLALLSGV